MSTQFPCSSLPGADAAAFVSAGWDKFSQYATESYDLAKVQVDGLNGFYVPFHTWDASFTGDGVLSGFIRPPVPELIAITPPPETNIPDAPSISVKQIALETAPEEPVELGTMPIFMLPATPGELTATRPGDAPIMNIPDAPIAPVITDPDAPILELIVLPDVPNIVIERFDEAAPVFDVAVPDETLNFTEILYTSPLLDKVRTQVTAMMDGQYYLPWAVADALWEQAVSREDRNALKLTQEVREQFGSRGFEEPNGIMAARLFEVQQSNANRRSELNRDIYTKSEQVAIENLRFSVQQGMALETTLIQAHLTVEARRFELVVKGREIAISIFQARITQFNAAVAAYNARIDAYKAFLDGLRAEVDIYKAQVDAAKVKGDLNESYVRMYAEQVRASLAKADMYRAQVEGFKSIIEAERAKIDGFRATVDAYSSTVDAYKTEWDAYRSRIEAEAEKGNLYETLAKVYATRVSAWQTKGNVAISEQEVNLKQAEAFLQQHDAQVRTLVARLDASRSLMASQVATNESATRIYSAQAAVEGAAVEADTRAFQAILEQSRTKVELVLRDAGLQVEQATKIAGLMLEAMKSSAGAASQLAASSFSAVNMGASVSSSNGYSRACSQSISYSGELIGLP